MRWIAIAAGVLLVASLVGSEEQAAEEESPLIYTLEVNGQPHPIKPGELRWGNLGKLELWNLKMHDRPTEGPRPSRRRSVGFWQIAS